MKKLNLWFISRYWENTSVLYSILFCLFISSQISFLFSAVDDLTSQSFETKPDYVQKEVHDASFKTADKEPKFQFFKPKPKLETVEKPFEPEVIAEKPQRKIEPPMKPATDFQRVIERKPEFEIVEKTNLPKSTLTRLEKFWADRIKGLEDHKAAERKIIQAQQIIQAKQKIQPGLGVVEKKFEPKLTAR